MTLADAAAIAQIAGVLGVLAILVFVGLQIRATPTPCARRRRRPFITTTPTGMRRSWATPARSLSPQKASQTTQVFRLRKKRQWKAGHLSNGLWAGWEALMMNLVNTRGGAEFQDHIAEIMKREPDPRARAFGVVPVKYVSGGGAAAKAL